MAQPIRLRLERLDVDPGKLAAPGAPLNLAMRRAGRKVVDQAKRNLTSGGHVDTGRLRNSGTWRLENVGKPSITALVIFETRYATWVEKGNGPPGSFIYPRRATLLRFKPKGSQAFVYARRVRASKPTEFLTKALDALKPGDLAP